MNKMFSVGFNSFVNVGMVDGIFESDAERLRKELKKRDIEKNSDAFWDACNGKTVKSLILLTDGRLIASAISPDTLSKRINDEYNGGRKHE